MVYDGVGCYAVAIFCGFAMHLCIFRPRVLIRTSHLVFVELILPGPKGPCRCMIFMLFYSQPGEISAPRAGLT